MSAGAAEVFVGFAGDGEGGLAVEGGVEGEEEEIGGEEVADGLGVGLVAEHADVIGDAGVGD